VRIDVECIGQDVDEHGRRAEPGDDFRSRGECKAWTKDGVASLDIARPQDQRERVSAVRTRDNFLGAAKIGEVGLQGSDFRAQNVLTMRQHARDRIVDHATKAVALRGQIDKRDGLGCRGGAFGHLNLARSRIA
jgi:hypothetical protein